MKITLGISHLEYFKWEYYTWYFTFGIFDRYIKSALYNRDVTLGILQYILGQYFKIGILQF